MVVRPAVDEDWPEAEPPLRAFGGALRDRVPAACWVAGAGGDLTRYGCNQGACHGKAAGQNGFRLSLRAYAPDWDYNWITQIGRAHV